MLALLKISQINKSKGLVLINIGRESPYLLYYSDDRYSCMSRAIYDNLYFDWHPARSITTWSTCAISIFSEAACYRNTNDARLTIIHYHPPKIRGLRDRIRGCRGHRVGGKLRFVHVTSLCPRVQAGYKLMECNVI